MCRLLFIKSESEFDIQEHLDIFSKICKNSKEYQGHGWGCRKLLWKSNIKSSPKFKRLHEY